MNIVYEIWAEYCYEYSGRNIKAVLPEIECTKYKGSTVMNIANEILGQLKNG